MPGLPVYRSIESKRLQEIRNGANQFLAALSYAEDWKVGNLDVKLLCKLQEIAITQIYS